MTGPIFGNPTGRTSSTQAGYMVHFHRPRLKAEVPVHIADRVCHSQIQCENLSAGNESRKKRLNWWQESGLVRSSGYELSQHHARCQSGFQIHWFTTPPNLYDTVSLSSEIGCLVQKSEHGIIPSWSCHWRILLVRSLVDYCLSLRPIIPIMETIGSWSRKIPSLLSLLNSEQAPIPFQGSVAVNAPGFPTPETRNNVYGTYVYSS